MPEVVPSEPFLVVQSPLFILYSSARGSGILHDLDDMPFARLLFTLVGKPSEKGLNTPINFFGKITRTLCQQSRTSEDLLHGTAIQHF